MKEDKILGGDLAIVNQILPHKHKWAWDLFIIGQSNNWVPTEVSMAKDIQQWKEKGFLSEDEKLLIRRCLGFFAGSESLVANNLLMSLFRYVSDAECRQYILRQAFEEALHNQTIVYICDSLGLDIKEVYEAYQTITSIKKKDDFLMSITKDINRQDFKIYDYPKQENGSRYFPYSGEFSVKSLNFDKAVSSRQEVLRNLITYYIICEGIFFYSGFAMLLSFGRQNKMQGIAEQIQYSLRDESVHLKFGTQLINIIIQQEPEIWTDKFKQDTINHIKTATELETEYAKDVLPNGILGLNSEMFVSYMKFIANRRLENIGLEKIFEDSVNPFPWLAETIDLVKNKNFFETRVTNYAVGDLVEDM